MFITDQTAQPVNLAQSPQRIISVVPSQTELLSYLGLEKETVGITKFCVHPSLWQQTKTKVGGTKNLNLAAIQALQPDLIIANKEENSKKDIKALAQHYPVYTSDIKNLQEALRMIRDIGLLTGKAEKAEVLVSTIENRFHSLKFNLQIPAAYFIWKKPYMAAGGQSFINAMMEYCGLINVFAAEPRYPVVSIEQLTELNCRLLLLSSEPFPFTEKHAREIREAGYTGEIIFVDGEMFSWYGSRLLEAPAYFQQLINKIFTSVYPDNAF
jgi:ABC-type Fe3+-hydroxamate transport system substrate-binding protein